MKNIVAILPSKQDIFYLKKTFEGKYNIIIAEDNGWNSYEASLNTFDPVEFTNKCIRLVKENNAAGIFYSDDFANFIASIVATETGLSGPHSDSMFIANNKFYSRETETTSIEYFAMDIHSSDWNKVSRFPLHVKPTSLYFSLLQATVKNSEELLSHIDLMRKHLPDWEAPFSKLFSKFADKTKYPLANVNLALCEEVIVAKSQHAIEGWTDRYGQHHIWAISDNNYSTEGWLDNNSYPSILDLDIKKKIVELSFNFADKIGMKNGFWNIEIWVMDNGELKITEINGRLCASMTPLYEAISGNHQYEGIVRLSLGEEFNHEELKPVNNKVGGMFSITSKTSGKISDLIDTAAFQACEKMNGVIKLKLMYPEDLDINWVQYGGVNCLARVWLVGKSYKEICTLANEIRYKVMR